MPLSFFIHQTVFRDLDAKALVHAIFSRFSETTRKILTLHVKHFNLNCSLCCHLSMILVDTSVFDECVE